MKRWQTLSLVYSGACPNCGGPAPAHRLEKGLPCPHCLPSEYLGEVDETSYYNLVVSVGRLLARLGRLRGYSTLYTGIRELQDFEGFFEKVSGSRLWSAQLTWAKRLLQGESLAIVAPTGVGKTTLLSAYTVYRAMEGARAYYLLPTENLVRQVYSKISSIASRASADIRVAVYYSSLSRKAREESIRRIAAGDYDVLVTTTSFISRRWDLLKGIRFDLVVVDDVDAVLRNSKNIDRLLLLLGFDEETVGIAYMLIKKQLAAIIAKISGKKQRYMKLLEEIEMLEARLASKMASTIPGQLVIASATGRARGLKPKLFRELLGFEVGRVYDYTRSISNFYIITNDPIGKTVEAVTTLGPGGIVFVAKRFGKDVAKEVVKRLQDNGVRAALVVSGRRALDRFEKGELDVLVGIASYYGVVVRGVDMPKRILYTVFLGVPSNSARLEKTLYSPHTIARVATELGLECGDELVKLVAKLSPGEATALRIALANGETVEEGRLAHIYNLLVRARRRIAEEIGKRLCGDGSVKRSLEIAGMVFRCVNGYLEIVTVDAATYVQASGRASRMLNGSMTHGVSVVVEEEADYVNLLRAKLSRFVESVEFEPYSRQRVLVELEKARESRADPSKAKRIDIETSLIIVESPTKAKTIAGFFGRPVRRRLGPLMVYETTFYNMESGKIHVAAIAASVGHVYDLSMDGEGIYGVVVDEGSITPHYKPIKRCLSCGRSFSSDRRVCPYCGSSNIVTKEDIVAALRQLAQENEVVYIATDPDIEGEKIAYDLYVLLRPYSRAIKRIELHEITRKELFKALANARSINRRMVDAQVVRRIEDRWIGFGLSQHLWQVFGKNWLGAGRVQTPVLGWIIDRYQEWRHSLGYNVRVVTSIGLRIRLHYGDAGEARRVAEEASRGVVAVGVAWRRVKLSPPPPYNTESLIYDASRRLGYTVQKTMRIAQDLFEAGLITYHRTDSVHVSSTGIGVAEKYLKAHDMGELFEPRSWGPPGHHEAIRPTRPISGEELRRLVATGGLRITVTLRESHYRLYDLIFRRFIASQMKPSTVEMVGIVLETVDGTPLTTIEVPVREVEQGFIQVYPLARLVPEAAGIKPGEVIQVERVEVKRGSSMQLYSHGDVVRLMRERGIGRPSTYARTIDSIIRHGYVIESRYRKKLIPTKLGVQVYSYLTEEYPSLVSEERTRRLQSEIDGIVSGDVEPTEVIEELYEEMGELLRQPRTVIGGVTQAYDEL